MEDTLEVVERLVDEDVGHFCDWGTNRNKPNRGANLIGIWRDFCALEKDSPSYLYPFQRYARMAYAFVLLTQRAAGRDDSQAPEVSRSAWTFLE